MYRCPPERWPDVIYGKSNRKHTCTNYSRIENQYFDDWFFTTLDLINVAR